MKKLTLFLAVLFAAAMTLTACSDKKNEQSDAYTNFVDKEKGFSIDVPEGLEKFDGLEAMGSTQFREGEKTWNSLSVYVHENIMGDDYSQEYIEEEFNTASCLLVSDDSKRVKERTADGYTCREEDDENVWFKKVIFQGPKYYIVEFYYQKAKADKYGEEVRKHVIDSFKITK